MSQVYPERGLHEIIDRAQLILTSWQAFVEEHPETQLHPDLLSISDQVTDLERFPFELNRKDSQIRCDVIHHGG